MGGIESKEGEGGWAESRKQKSAIRANCLLEKRQCEGGWMVYKAKMV